MKNLLKTIIVIFLIAATAVIGWFSYGYRNWSLDEWKQVWSETIQENPTNDNTQEDQSEDNISESAMSLSMTSSGNKEVVVQATVTPENAANKEVDWSLQWNEPSSEWANGKDVNDYVFVLPSSDGSTTATVSATKPFGEKIILKCTSRDNANVFATCTLDYAKKVSSIDIVIKNNGETADGIFWSADGQTYDIEFVPTYDEVYTVDDSFDFTCSIIATDDFIESVQVQSSFYGPDGSSFIQQNLVSKKTSTLSDLKIVSSYQNLTESYLSFRSGQNAVSSKIYNAAVNNFKQKVAAYSGNIFDITITATGNYSTYSTVSTITSTGANFTVSTEEVSLSETTIIF